MEDKKYQELFIINKTNKIPEYKKYLGIIRSITLNKINNSWNKYDDIIKLNIPEEDKEIAYSILQEEKSYYHKLFNAMDKIIIVVMRKKYNLPLPIE